jgi:hypothetical protein
VSTPVTRTPREAGLSPWYGYQHLAKPLLFPVIFAVGVALAYLGAFHDPTPRDLRVDLVGPPATTQPLLAALRPTLAGRVALQEVNDPAAARRQVLDRTVDAAYAPGPDRAELVVGTASSPSIASAARTIFTEVAAREGRPLAVTDLRPTQPGDRQGTTPFYLMIALSIAGYMSAIVVSAVATVIASHGLLLADRVRLAAVAVTTLVIAVLTALVADQLYGALTGHFWQLVVLGWLYALVPGLLGLGLHHLLHRNTTMVMVLLFVVLNFPSASGAYDVRLSPAVFRALHAVMPGGALVTALRDVVYLDSHGLRRPLLVLAAWLLGSAAVLALSGRLTRRRAPRPPLSPAQAQAQAELEIGEGAVGA